MHSSAHADKWEQSLAVRGSLAYKGSVPPEAIKTVLTFKKPRKKSVAYYRKLKEQQQKEYEQYAKEYAPCTGEKRETASV